MTKLCPRGKAAAKRKFKVYPSAYANAYASKICAGKIKDPSGVKRKDFRGSKAGGGRAGFKGGGADSGRIGQLKSDLKTAKNRDERIAAVKKAEKAFRGSKAKGRSPKGGLMEATERLKRQGLRGGGLCKRGMNREAIGKNS